LAVGAACAPAWAQQLVVPGSELDAYVRLLEISGRLHGTPLVFRPIAARHLGATLLADSAHPWESQYPLGGRPAAPGGIRVTPLEPFTHSVYQSAYPRSVNDGALWAGKGLSSEASTGAMLTWGPLTATLMPTLSFATNDSFATAPVDPGRLPFVYPWWGGIDWPQRPGAETVTAFDWGQSGIRLDLGGFTAGVGTENLWWGPAQKYPILMSNTAPGFPHLDLGTGRPVRTPIGKVETRLVWGVLSESGHFDTDSTNDRRFFTGVTAALEPRWLPGLTLGMGRVFYMPWDSVRAHDAAVLFQSVFKKAFGTPANPEGTDYRDQILSIYARWVIPEGRVEFYGEWARNDHNYDLRDFLLEPDHSQAWVLGFARAFPAGTGLWRLRGELATLERSSTVQVRAAPLFYIHGVAIQGYTQRGQLIGAGIGPGSSSQLLGLDRYTAAGRIGGYIERTRYDNDAYYFYYAPTQAYYGHDVELTAGVSAVRFVGHFDLTGAVALSRELNRYFEVENDVTSLRAEVGVRWRVR
jgi:hypothetical protein